MRIYLDFDDVLFDTKGFLLRMQEIFSSFGVDQGVFRSTYEEMRSEAGGKSFCYTFSSHIQKIEACMPIKSQELQVALDTFIQDTRPYVFADTRPLLTFLHDLGYQLNILSFGDSDFQRKKIASTDLDGLVHKVIVTEKDKTEALLLEDLDSQEDIWFFDDRVHFLENVKKALPFIKTILVQRPEGRFQDEVTTVISDYRVENLEAIKKLFGN